MNYYCSPWTDVRRNLRLEEELFRSHQEEILLLWQNAPCIILGKHQNVEAEVVEEVRSSQRLPIVKRMTGGGAVYQDLGNLNFSVIRNRADLSYEDFLTPIIEVLSQLGVEAVYNERNDLLAGGRKISGNAQVVHGNRMLHHGTLLFSSDLQMLSRVLIPDPKKLARNQVVSISSRVGNLSGLLENSDVTMELLKRKILDYYRQQEDTFEPLIM